jgi:hypothetical protein
MQILTQLITAACEGRLDAPLFHRMFRKRRSFGPYLDALRGRLEQSGRPRLAALCNPQTGDAAAIPPP